MADASPARTFPTPGDTVLPQCPVFSMTVLNLAW